MILLRHLTDNNSLQGIEAPMRSFVTVILLCACLTGCYRAVATDQACFDRAGKEVGLYLQAVRSAMPPQEQVLSVDTWNGCGSAGNGAAVDITMSSELTADALLKRLDDDGWDLTGEGDGIRMTKQVGHRVFGLRIEEMSADDAAPYQSAGTLITIVAADTCWDDSGYRC